jgi:hypothetical protein
MQMLLASGCKAFERLFRECAAFTTTRVRRAGPGERVSQGCSGCARAMAALAEGAIVNQ